MEPRCTEEGCVSALAFFLDRYKSEIPGRIHSRDTAENGNPDWSHAFESWLTDGEGRWSTSLSEEQTYCEHPTKERPCPACGDSGLRVRTRHTYRYPAKRALRVLRQIRTPKGRPTLDVLLMALADNEGNYAMTAQALRSQYSVMWEPRRAARLIDFALSEFRRVYRDEPPIHIERRSEAQLNAEVAA